MDSFSESEDVSEEVSDSPLEDSLLLLLELELLEELCFLDLLLFLWEFFFRAAALLLFLECFE